MTELMGMMLTIVPLFSFPCHLTNIKVLNGPFIEYLFCLSQINKFNYFPYNICSDKILGSMEQHSDVCNGEDHLRLQ